VRLILLGLLGTDHPARDAISLSPAMEFLERWHLGELGGHHELAADVHGDSIFFGEAPHGGGPGRAQRRLETARPVVEPGVNDAGVVAGLMLTGTRLLLQHGY
jgi:hypothetical protein